jgi:hypothetical protein
LAQVCEHLQQRSIKGEKMDGYLSDEKQDQMRKLLIIKNDEVVLRIGDILIAENVITRERRVVGNSANEGRQVLKG